MKRKIILSFCLTAALLLVCFPQAALAAPSTASLQSITWQDPHNTVLLWNAVPGYTYQVYRASSLNGSYTLLGTASCGSYRDDTASYPQAYFYKIQAVAPNGTQGELSAPMQAGTNPDACKTICS